MNYTWDEDKNQSNRIKHGISFETAILVFNDPYYLEVYDVEHSQNEDRYIVIGKVEEVLFVVYTERKNSIRLISARLADKKERRLYYDQDNGYY